MENKFNIKNFSSYSIISEHLTKVKYIINSKKLEMEKKELRIYFDLLMKPIKDLTNSKFSEYNKATQAVILILNIQLLIKNEFKSFEELFDEDFENFIKELKEIMVININNEFCKFLQIYNIEMNIKKRIKNKEENLLKENVLNIKSFLIKFFENENYCNSFLK